MYVFCLFFCYLCVELIGCLYFMWLLGVVVYCFALFARDLDLISYLRAGWTGSVWVCFSVYFWC